MAVPKYSKTIIHAIASAIICLSGIFVSSILQSRAFCIGFTVSLWLLLWCYFPKYSKKINLWGWVVVLILMVVAFQLKLDSSLGRVLIYKISFTILKEHYITGIGFGAFKKVYLEYQGMYFAAGHYSEKELLLADNTIYAFNDYFQIIIEEGIVGILIVIGYWILLFKLIKEHITNRYLIFDLALIVVVTLSVAALFTHAYDNYYFQIALILSIPLLIYKCYPILFKDYLKCYWIGLAVIIFLLTDGTQRLINYKAYNAFAEAVNLSRSGFKREAQDTLQAIYPELKNNGYYLSIYGKQLLYDNQAYTASIILSEALSIISDADDYVQLAKAYSELKQSSKAETALIKAINMVPNRFRSRFELYVFYKQTGQISKARSVAKLILNLPVKIDSPIINYIKSSVRL